jgi:serine/threonine protein phosphatase PrpC
MSGQAPPDGPLVDWGFAAAALDGVASGDLHVVAPFPSGVLIAVIDGLGHGPEAAEAAAVAASVLESHASAPVDELVRRCHTDLHKTRGAVLTVASIHAPSSTLAWCGVGNVEGVLLRARPGPGRAHDAAPTRGGVVGYRLPPLKVSEVALYAGDLIVLASDGIRGGFTHNLRLEQSPQELADLIFARHAKGSDDALVLVARYLEGPP